MNCMMRFGTIVIGLGLCSALSAADPIVDMSDHSTTYVVGSGEGAVGGGECCERGHSRCLFSKLLGGRHRCGRSCRNECDVQLVQSDCGDPCKKSCRLPNLFGKFCCRSKCETSCEPADPCRKPCLLDKLFNHGCKSDCKPQCEAPKASCDDPCKKRCLLDKLFNHGCKSDCKPQCEAPKASCDDPCKKRCLLDKLFNHGCKSDCKPQCEDPCKKRCKLPKLFHRCKSHCKAPCEARCEQPKEECGDPCKKPCLLDKLFNHGCKTGCKPRCAKHGCDDPCKKSCRLPKLFHGKCGRNDRCYNRCASIDRDDNSQELVPELLGVLKHDCDPMEREDAARALHAYWCHSNPEIALGLAEALNDRDSLVRLEAAESLGQIGCCNEEAIAALERTVRGDWDKEVRKAALKSLTQCGACGKSNGIIPASGIESPAAASS